MVLRRLDQADAEAVVAAIRNKIWILNRMIPMPAGVAEARAAAPVH